MVKVLHTAEMEEMATSNTLLCKQAAQAAELAHAHADTLEAALQERWQVRPVVEILIMH